MNPAARRLGSISLALALVIPAAVAVETSRDHSQELGTQVSNAHAAVVGSVPVEFVSRGATLKGTLYLPAVPGPHPAIVTVNGSGRLTRHDQYPQQIARYFPPRGIAVLAFDKRGCGESGGDYPGSYGSSMVVYANDVVAPWTL